MGRYPEHPSTQGTRRTNRVTGLPWPTDGALVAEDASNAVVMNGVGKKCHVLSFPPAHR